MKFRYLTLILTFFLFDALVLKSVAGLAISPPLLDLSNTSINATNQILNPGDRYRGSFKVIFAEDDPEVLYLYVRRLDIEDGTGEAVITDMVLQEKDSLDKWIRLDQSSVFKPENIGQCNGCNVVDVNYEINIPSYVIGGAYYAGIVVSKSPPKNLSGSAVVAIGEELVYQVFVNLNGKLNYNSRVFSFSTLNNQLIFTSLPVTFVTTLENNGNVYVVPKGYIDITSGGTKIRDLGSMFNPGLNRLFPGKTRVFYNTFTEEGFDVSPTSIDDLNTNGGKLSQLKADTLLKYPYVYESLGDQNQKFLFFEVPKYHDADSKSQNFFYGLVYHINSYFENLFYQISHFRIGFHSANLDLFLGNQPPVSASTTFFVFPAHLIFTIVVIFGAVYNYFRRKNEKSKRLISKKSKK
jgi:hypothetical protein